MEELGLEYNGRGKINVTHSFITSEEKKCFDDIKHSRAYHMKANVPALSDRSSLSPRKFVITRILLLFQASNFICKNTICHMEKA